MGARRALLIGSQTGSLTGVHGDVEVMAATLRALDFDVDAIIEGDATSTGITTSYQALVDATAADDAVVVYYSGHGGRSVNPMSTSDPDQPRWLQYILPTDIDDRSGGTFRGILAEELSELQRQLTNKSANVTTILDCCHSARMFRDPELRPRANDNLGFPWEAVSARWQQVKAGAEGPLGDVNPFAVQVVACEPDQSAYELSNSSIGGSHGALTAALVSILRRPDAQQLSWREVIEIVRPSILDVVPSQRPDILGPQAARLLFSLTAKDTTGVLSVAESAGRIWLERASLFGVGEGDSYALVAPGATLEGALATGVVDQVTGDRARLLVEGTLASPLPAGTLAYPRDVSFGRRPIVVTPATHPDRSVLTEAFRRSPSVRVVDDARGGVLATLALGDDGVTIQDAQGEPLSAKPRPVTDATVKLIGESLVRLARATHVRELGSDSSADDLQDVEPDVVTLAYTRLDPVTKQEVPIESGEHLFVGDAVVIRAQNATSETRYLSVLDVGLTGAVTIMTNAQPSGTTIATGSDYVVGVNAANVVEGVSLFWPDGLPAGAPRVETLISLVSDHAINGLTALEQTGVATRGAAKQGGMSPVERLIEDLSTGMRDARPPDVEVTPIRYHVHRFDFLLHPTTRPAGGDEREPAFEIDARPDPTFRLVTPRGAGPTPDHVSVRLSELTVHSNRSILAAKVRIDFLVVTAATGDSVSPFHAESVFFDRVKDNTRLPFDNLLIYDGPVGRFLDIAVWVSKAEEEEVKLADMLKTEVDGTEVAGAITTLAALAVAAPAAAAVAGSVGAVATLVRTGARVLSAVAGTSIGVYRTSLLPHERFGAGDPSSRHPINGTIAAQDMSFAYEVVDATPPAVGS